MPWLVLFLVVSTIYAFAYAYPPYSPDSWSYVELARTVFDDFYRVTTLRYFGGVTEYSAAFPPLWPVEIAVVDRLTGLGPRTGYVLTFVCFLTLTGLSEAIGRIVFGRRLLGLTASLVMLSHGGFLGELLAARAIPQTMAILALILLVYIREGPVGVKRGVALGALIGLAVMTRYDALPVAVGLGALIVAASHRPLATGASYSVALLVVVSPWVVYSMSTFGVPFATDNGPVVLAASPEAYVTDWYPGQQLTLFEDPRAWLGKIFVNSVRLSLAVPWSIFGTTILLPLTAVFCLRRLKVPWLLGLFATVERRRFLASGILSVAAMPSYLLTGYIDSRYFAPLVWWLNLLAIGVIVAAVRTRNFTHRTVLCGFLAAAFVISAGIAYQAWRLDDSRRLGNAAAFENPQWVLNILRCGFGAGSGRLLFLGDNRAAAQFGALTGLPTSMEPRTVETGRLTRLEIDQFLRAFGVEYVYAKGAAEDPAVVEQFLVEPLDGCEAPLFRVLR